MLRALSDDENGGCRKCHANGIEEYGEAQDLVEGVCKKEHYYADERVNSEAHSEHIAFLIFFSKCFGQDSILAHGIHHTRIAEQQNIYIGQYGDEQ